MAHSRRSPVAGKRERRPTRQEEKRRREKHRNGRKALHAQQLLDGLIAPERPTASNATSKFKTKEEEAAHRTEVTAAYIAKVKPQFSRLLAELGQIKDPRDPKKVEHQLVLVIFYGIVCFLLQAQSRREANRELTGPVVLEHLRQHFPELESLPHQDTVNRLLSRIDVEKIQDSLMEMVRRLIRNKKFDRFLINGLYPIAIDGTQKLKSVSLISPEWQERTHNKGTEAEQTRYHVYVLEACLAFSNGLTLPLLSEFLNYEEGDRDAQKQDCETKAFHRLVARLKTEFPRLPIILLLDGLYANGPIIEDCEKCHWQYMIVLKDGSLPSVWPEFQALLSLAPENHATRLSGVRRQDFRWVNGIDYCYGANGRNRLKLHLVECLETWEEIDPETGKPVAKTSRHVWISSERLTKSNLHERCNLGARHRWNIEEAILAEKRHGYQYEHCFSKNWKAMKGYHYLMHLAHALNALAQFAEDIIDVVRSKGVRAFIRFIRDCLVQPWFTPSQLSASLPCTLQLRLT